MNATSIVALIVVGVLILWVLPIVLGIREARRKNRSPHWMWTAIYPLLAWIPFIVLRSLPALKVCSQCAEKVNENARICRYCGSSFED